MLASPFFIFLDSAVMASNPVTPQRPIRTNARVLLQSTPQNRGTASQYDHHVRFTCPEIEEYIAEDLTGNKVLLPHDKFLEVILNVPPQWETSAPRFKKLVDKVERNSRFRRTLATYTDLCDDETLKHEKELYADFINVCNDASDIVQRTMDTPKGDAIFVFRQTDKIVRGSNRELKPDVGGILRQMFDTSENIEYRHAAPTYNFGWPQYLDARDLKLHPRLLDHGHGARVVLYSDGKDPRDFFPHSEKYIAAQRTIQKYSIGLNEIHHGVKRNCASAVTYPHKRSCPSNRSTKTTASVAVPVVYGPEPLPEVSSAKDDAKDRFEVLAQMARYALAMLSYAGFRTHSISLLVARNYVQVLYYDRSALVASPPFDMKNRRRFASLLVALQLLTLPQRGVMDAFMPDPFLRIYQNYTKEMSADPTLLLAGQKLFLTVKEKRVEITLGRIIYRQPGIIGRSTCVVEGQCAEWPKKKIVVKISWPAVERLSEVGMLDNITKAVAAAGKKAAWVLNHIPTTFHSQDFPLADDSPGMRLHNLLNDKDTAYAEDTGCFTYELRVCRIIVQERLYPLSELASPKEYGQVFFDVLQVHRWIYQFARILHRDISEGNIMWHVRGKRICGVLNDFDLSSHLDWPGQTSQHRTGTRPFMAEELHVKDVDVLPLYRHDLESLFYVILLVVCAHSIRQIGTQAPRLQVDTTEGRRWHEWLVMTDKDLLAAKNALMNLSAGYIPPVPTTSFSGFARRLSELHDAFSMGFRAIAAAKVAAAQVLRRQAAGDDEWDEGQHTQRTELRDESDEDEGEAAAGVVEGDWDEGTNGSTTQETPLPAVDVETLNGHVTYAVFYNALKAGLVGHFPPT